MAHVQDPTINLLGLPQMSSQNHIDQSSFCRKKRKGCRIMVRLFFPNLPIYFVKSLSFTEAASLTPTTTIVFEPHLLYLGSRSYDHCNFWAIILSKVRPGGWWFGSYIGTFRLKWVIMAIVLGSFLSVYHLFNQSPIYEYFLIGPGYPRSRVKAAAASEREGVSLALTEGFKSTYT